MNRTCRRSVTIISASILLIALLNTHAFAQRKAGGGGGNKKPPNVSKPSNANRSSNAGAGAKKNNSPSLNNNNNNRNNNDRNNNGGNRNNNNGGNRNNNGGDRNINGGNKNNVGNKVNIDNSKKNVNINVNNSKNVNVSNRHNTSVRHVNNYRPYPRPPYRYGGYRYACYRPYFYHPYRPFVWGPVWHPWGFFVATLATTAIIIAVADNDVPPPVIYESGLLTMGNNEYTSTVGFGMSGPNFTDYEVLNKSENAEAFAQDYYYDQGVFYIKADGGYTVVAAPVGATIKTLPTGYETVKLDDGSTNYYYGGAFYEKSSGGYTVVAPTAGTFVEHISDGGEEVTVGDVKYVKIGDTYYQPVKENGKDGYEIASVEEDK